MNLFSKILKPIKGSRNSSTGNLIRQIHRYAEGSSLSLEDRYWRLCAIIDEESVDNIIEFSYDEKEYFRRKREKLKPFGTGNSLNDNLFMDVNMVLCDDMLVKVDMMSMNHSLEVRVPFLNHEVVNLAFFYAGRF